MYVMNATLLDRADQKRPKYAGRPPYSALHQHSAVHKHRRSAIHSRGFWRRIHLSISARRRLLPQPTSHHGNSGIFRGLDERKLPENSDPKSFLWKAILETRRIMLRITTSCLSLNLMTEALPFLQSSGASSTVHR
jgi:hypothetical protein